MLGPGESILKDSTQGFVTAGDSGGEVVLVMVVVVEVMALVVMVDGNTFCICRNRFHQVISVTGFLRQSRWKL